MLVRSKPQGLPATQRFFHQALFYESADDFVGAALPFVRSGIEEGEPVLARVRRDNAEALNAALGDDARSVDVEPAERFYETPLRTRAKLLRWIGENGDGPRVRIIGEAPWPLDSDAGIREWERHESVLNVAFRDLPVSFLCPYDAGSLPPSIIEAAESTHPSIRRTEGEAYSPSYASPEVFCGRLNDQTPVRTGRPTFQMPFVREDLRAVRKLVSDECAAAGLGGTRLLDLTIAVDEVATNAVLHGATPAHLKMWREPRELIWEVSDTGPGIADPLAGQLAPEPSAPGGRGLWMARMICDALEFRSDGSGTVVAMHVSLPTS